MGATCSVFLGRPKRGELAAVKVLADCLIEDDRIGERFFAEPMMLKKFDHPNVLRLLRADLDNEQPWFATEYCTGGSLAERITKGDLDTHSLLLLMLETCDAVQYLHDEGCIHRDIKPENLLLDKFGAVRVCDFGIAHSRVTNLTCVGDILGTPSFMAPEQMADASQATPQSDVFSIGATLYSCVTRSSALPLVIAGRRDVALSKLPSGLRGIIEAATDPMVEHRCPSAKDLADLIVDLV